MSEFLSDSDSYDELFQACEGFIGNLNTLHARAGEQIASSFSSLAFS